MELVKSDVVMAYDTLPALKAVNYCCGAEELRVYTYAQMYFLKNTLCLRLIAFEREPEKTSGVAFAIGGSGEHFLTLRMLPQKTELFLCEKNPKPDLWHEAPGQRVAAPKTLDVQADDEQGWYWGIQAEINPEILQKAGVMPNGGGMRCAILKYNTVSKGYGASFLPENAKNPAGF